MRKLVFYNSEDIKKELFKNKKVKDAYDALGPEFDMISSVIRKRIQKKMTQAQLAKKLGTKQSAIARLEGGTYNPSFRFLQKVARAMDAKLSVTLS
jgi:DNA-binding XRE family transcriptional regulator